LNIGGKKQLAFFFAFDVCNLHIIEELGVTVSRADYLLMMWQLKAPKPVLNVSANETLILKLRTGDRFWNLNIPYSKLPVKCCHERWVAASCLSH